MVEHTFEDKKQVIKQGDSGDHFYIIFSGKFEAYAESAAKPTARTVADSDDPAPEPPKEKNELGFPVVQTFAPGEGFGELALLYNSPRAVSVRAMEDKSVAYALDRQAFRQLVMHHNSGVKVGLEKVRAWGARARVRARASRRPRARAAAAARTRPCAMCRPRPR
jgi:CRP-like cAMP-binding protein